jgi:glycosyltransferase involved in cell wall biosynthesis
MLRRSPDLILFNSRAGRRSHLAAGIRGRRNKVLPNGFDLSRFRPDPEARRRIRDLVGLRDELVLGCVARLDPLKGHRVLLEAFSRVQGAIPEARLLLVGTGVSFDNPDFAAVVPRSLDPSTVIAAGPADDVPPWLAAMDVAVMPSLVEGFPNALGEAMSCGLVCIATDAGDAKRMLGTHGYLVPTGEIEALASAMVAAIRREEAQRREIGLAARARIAQHYSLERTIDAHAILYRRLADGVPGRASRHHA